MFFLIPSRTPDLLWTLLYSALNSGCSSRIPRSSVLLWRPSPSCSYCILVSWWPRFPCSPLKWTLLFPLHSSCHCAWKWVSSLFCVTTSVTFFFSSIKHHSECDVKDYTTQYCFLLPLPRLLWRSQPQRAECLSFLSSCFTPSLS